MKSHIFIFISMLSPFAWSKVPIASEILGDLRNMAPRAVVTKYYSNDDSRSELLQNIMDGGPEWIEVRVKLLEGTDAYYTTSTYNSLGWALWRNPEHVLPYIASGQLPEKVCTPFLSAEVPVTPFYLAVNDAIIRISAVADKELQKSKEACLKQMNQVRAIFETTLNKASNPMP